MPKMPDFQTHPAPKAIVDDIRHGEAEELVE
jgi:hypothetical protein